jgi:hypothetical protein
MHGRSASVEVGVSEFVDRWREKTTKPLSSSRVLGLAGCLVTALSVLFFVLFLWAAYKRMRYPFDIEWIESGILVSVLRILHGQRLYVAPTLHYVPFLYTPLYMYIAAAVTKIVGVTHGYLGMRLVSTLSSLATAAVIYAFVRTETPKRVPAIAAAGLYMASYAVVGGFYDVGRVDSLFVFLLVAALLLQRRGYPVLAAVVWVLVFQTKQSVLPLAVVILLAEWQRPKRMLLALTTFAGLAALSIAGMNHATGGWYSFYAFHVAHGLPPVLRLFVLFVPLEVAGPMPVAWGIILAAVIATRVRFERAMFYIVVSFALIGGIWFVESHRGAAGNSVIPVYAWTSVLFGISLARLLKMCEGRTRFELAVLLAAAVQLIAMIYNPGRFVLPADTVARRQAFVDHLRSIPGDVWLANHSYDAVLAGREPNAEGEALGAVIDADPKGIGAKLHDELYAKMNAHAYAAVVVDTPDTHSGTWGFDRYYPLEISIGLDNYRYLSSQPEWFLLPCDASPSLIARVMREDSVESRTSCRK